MVPGHDIDRGACIGDFDQGRHGHVHQRRGHLAPVEQVAAVHDQVYIPVEGGLQGDIEIGEEIVSAAPSLDSRAKREVKAQVRVSDQEHADCIGCRCGAAHRHL